MMMDVADQLGEIFQPDAVNKITDHMDMAINSGNITNSLYLLWIFMIYQYHFTQNVFVSR